MTDRLLSDATENLLEDLAITLIDIEKLDALHLTLYGCGAPTLFSGIDVGAWRGRHLLDPYERDDLARRLETAFVRCAPETRFILDPTRDAVLLGEVFMPEDASISAHRLLAARARVQTV